MTIYYPDIYIIEDVQSLLHEIVKYGDLLKTLFRVKPIDRNSLWEPVMEVEARRFFDLVTDLYRSRSIPPIYREVLPYGEARRIFGCLGNFRA